MSCFARSSHSSIKGSRSPYKSTLTVIHCLAEEKVLHLPKTLPQLQNSKQVSVPYSSPVLGHHLHNHAVQFKQAGIHEHWRCFVISEKTLDELHRVRISSHEDCCVALRSSQMGALISENDKYRGNEGYPIPMTHFGFEKAEATLIHRKGFEREPFLSDHRIV